MREQLQQLRMLLWMVLHHRWAGLAAAVIFCAAGWAAVKMGAEEYQVEAKVFLDSKAALRPLLGGEQGQDGASPEQMAVLVKRTLLTRESVLKVIEQTDLKDVANSPEALERLVQGVSKNIKVKRVMVGVEDEVENDKSPLDIYTVSYRTSDAQRAKDVVEIVLNLFRERLSELSRSGAQEAGAFLDAEIASYSQQLAQAEDQLKQFKLEHPDVLINKDGEGYSQRLENLARELENARLALREAEYRSTALRAQISAISSTRSVVSTGGAAGPTALDGRIEAAQVKLQELQTSFTDKHPDVIAAKAALDSLLQQKREGRDKVAGGGVVYGPGGDVSGPRLMLAEAEARASAMRDQIVVLERQLADMKPIADKLPKVEAELAKLNRDYDVIKQTYGKLVQRRELIKLTEGAQAGDSMFKVIEPPRVPTVPVSLPRTLMSSIVLGLAIPLGLGVAWLRAQGRPTFYTRSQLASLSGVPVLGAISMNWTGGQVAKRRLGMAVFAIAFVGLLGAYLAVMTHFGYDLNAKLREVTELATRYGILRA
jgi:polysaccharide chain length determinant protein (PEP-CTERM system associated)